MCIRDRRERERETETERERDRDRETNRDADRERERELIGFHHDRATVIFVCLFTRTPNKKLSSGN